MTRSGRIGGGELFVVMALAIAMTVAGCSNVRLPAIDPSGERFFLPGPTYTSFAPDGPGEGILPAPAFVQPPVPPPCNDPMARSQESAVGSLLYPARAGELHVVPTLVVAPVSSEVIIVGGVCGSRGKYVSGTALEWLLSQESVGNFVQAGTGPRPRLQQIAHPSNGKRSANFIKTTAAKQAMVIDRGTETPLDDVPVQPGQGWVTITSPSEGTSHVTVWAPAAKGWDKRRKTTTIHWIDATWQMPPCATVLSGSEHDLVVKVVRDSTGEPVVGWLVEYEILPESVPAGFVPSLSTKARVPTGEDGTAVVRLRQPSDKLGPGQTQVQVTLIRPENAAGTSQRLEVAQTISTIEWSSPAITLRADGPSITGRGGEFVYSVEVSNPGNLPAENVRLAIGRPDAIELLSATPSPTSFGDQWIWNLGTIPGRTPPTRIDIAVRAIGQGTAKTCFVVVADNVERQTEACVETKIQTACLGFRFAQEPKEGRVGETAEYRLLVTNECEEPLTNIVVEADFDRGFALPGQRTPIGLPSFDLPFGGSRELALPLQITAAGTHCLRVAISADGGHTVRAQTCLVAQDTPRATMELSLNGPRGLRRGVAGAYELRVQNSGNVPLRAVQLRSRVSEELKIQRMSVPARVEGADLVADLSPIDPRSSIVIAIEILGLVPTEGAVFEVVGLAEGTETSTAMPIQVTLNPGDARGVEAPAPPNQDFGDAPGFNAPDGMAPPPVASNGRLELALTELVDPVNLGEETAIVVSLRNAATAMDADLEVLLRLPPGLTFVRSDQANLTFVPDPNRPDFLRATRREMRPGDELNGRIFLRGVQPGEQTVRASAISSSARTPVETSTAITVNP